MRRWAVVLLVVLVGAFIVIAGFVALFDKVDNTKPAQSQRYFYSRKDQIMTNAEWVFFERLNSVAAGRYYVFPQIHLSSLLKNETKGKYYKLSFQRINRRSVDFVLCDIQTRTPIYAVELDDVTHDQPKRKYRDEMVGEMLASVNLPLVRFRNVGSLSDEQIKQSFAEAKTKTSGLAV